MRWSVLLLLVVCTDGDEGPVEPVSEAPPIRSCEVVIRHTPEVPSLTVDIAGTFTNWEPLALEGPDEDGAWRVPGGIAPGDYPHKFIYGGKWEDTPRGVRTQWLDGVENRNLSVRDCAQPKACGLCRSRHARCTGPLCTVCTRGQWSTDGC